MPPRKPLVEQLAGVGFWVLIRDAEVRTRTRYILLIRALLRQHGYRAPSDHAASFVRRVQGLPLPGRLLSVVPMGSSSITITIHGTHGDDRPD